MSFVYSHQKNYKSSEHRNSIALWVCSSSKKINRRLTTKGQQETRWVVWVHQTLPYSTPNSNQYIAFRLIHFILTSYIMLLQYCLEQIFIWSCKLSSTALGLQLIIHCGYHLSAFYYFMRANWLFLLLYSYFLTLIFRKTFVS